MSGEGGEKTANVEMIVKNALAEAKRLRDIEKAAERAANKSKEKGSEKAKEVETFGCPECGGKVFDMEKFCHHCGIELEWEI